LGACDCAVKETDMGGRDNPTAMHSNVHPLRDLILMATR